jgi:antitoxin (DNA-binding transcriptional repressor) of toxin-antitoxin stability system
MTIDIRELSQKIDEGFAQSLAGEEVVIMDGDTPKVKLVPVSEISSESNSPIKPRIAGLNRGAYQIADDFDEPLGDEFWELKD